MKRLKLIGIPLIALMAFSTNAKTPFEDICSIRNVAFNAGEKVSYSVFYSAAGTFNLEAGTATFTNTLETLNNKPVYHIVGEGKTTSSYDWIYKVRDKYETYIDTSTMQTLKFVRNVNEGGFKKYQNVTFNKSANTAVTSEGVYKVPVCVQDVVSAVFYSWPLSLAVFGFRLLLQGFILFKAMKKLNESDLWPLFLFFDLWMFFYYIIFAPSLWKKPRVSWN